MEKKIKEAARRALERDKGKPVKESPEQPHVPKPPPPPPDSVEAYFDSCSGKFFFRNAVGEFQPVKRDLLSLELRANRYYKTHSHDNGLTYLEQEILRLVKERSVHFAGPLGGFPVGRHDVLGTRLLVTKGPKFLEPTKGDWPFFRTFLSELLRDQAKYFCAWLKIALTSLRRGLPWAVGQALAIAGDSGCGKSLLQSLLTPMLGGRVSKPYKHISGDEKFNAEVFGAEHALIGDETAKTDWKERANLGAAIKTLVANPEQHIRGMHKESITLTPFIRLSITLNDDPTALMILPPLDRNVTDKVILLRATKATMPFPSKRFPDYPAFYQQLVSELPHFLWHLRRWKIPEAIQHHRYGVVSFKDIELVEKLDDLSPEFKLWNLIERCILTDGFSGEWKGMASQLEAILRQKAPMEMDRLCRWNSATGQFLAKLAMKMPAQVSSEPVGKNRQKWTIKPAELVPPPSSSFQPK